MRHNFAWYLVFLFFPSLLLGHSFNFDAGAFSINSKTSTSDAKLSNFGIYKISYSIPVNSHLDIRPGYSLYTLDTSGSDLGYGIDIEVVGYPFTTPRRYQQQTQGIDWSYYGNWHPYIVISFHQRQYQSIQSTYAGLGFALGAAYNLNDRISIHSEVKSLGLKGPASSRIYEYQIIGGLGLEID